MQHRAFDTGMRIAQGRQAIGAIAAGICIITDSNVGGVEQPHQGGQQQCAGHQRLFFAGFAGHLQGDGRGFQHLRYLPANAWQGLCKSLHTLELVFALLNLPIGVVTVLLSAPRIATRGLQMAIGQRANPDIGIRWWNSQLVDTGDFCCIRQWFACQVAVAVDGFAVPR